MIHISENVLQHSEKNEQTKLIKNKNIDEGKSDNQSNEKQIIKIQSFFRGKMTRSKFRND